MQEFESSNNYVIERIEKTLEALYVKYNQVKPPSAPSAEHLNRHSTVEDASPFFADEGWRFIEEATETDIALARDLVLAILRLERARDSLRTGDQRLGWHHLVELTCSLTEFWLHAVGPAAYRQHNARKGGRARARTDDAKKQQLESISTAYRDVLSKNPFLKPLAACQRVSERPDIGIGSRRIYDLLKNAGIIEGRRKRKN